MRIAVAVSVGVLMATGCAAPSYLARVNGEKVTTDDLKQEFKRNHFALEKLLVEESEVRKYVDKVVDRRLLIQEAYRIGLQDDPEISQATADFEGRKLMQYILKREIEEKARPTDEEVKAVYELTGETLELRQIVVATREEAEAIRAQLEGGADFDTLAREKSIVRTRRNGGKLYPTGWGAKDEAWERAAFALRTDGELSPVFQSDEGWEVLQLEARKTVEKPPFDKSSHFIKAILERRKTAAREREFLGDLWTRYDTQVLERCDRSVAALTKALDDKIEVPCATWKGGSLSQAGFAARVNLGMLAKVPAGEYAEMSRTALEDLVYERLLKLEAAARGYAAVPEIAEAVRRHREDLMETRLYDQHVYRGVAVTDDEVKTYFDAHRAELVTQEKRNVAQILAETPEAAAEVKAKLAAGEPFDALAKAYSKDPRNAEKGGVVGWIDTTGMPEAFAPVFATAEGQVTEPLKSEQGWHIVKVLAVQPSRPRELAEAQTEIREKLLAEKHAARKGAWLGELRKAAEIDVSRAGIRKYVKDHDWRRNPNAPAPKAPRAPGGAKQADGAAAMTGAGHVAPAVDVGAAPPAKAEAPR